MKKWSGHGFVVLLFVSHSCIAQSIDGFITNVVSPTGFYLGSVQIELGATTQCETSYLDSEIRLSVDNPQYGLMPSDNEIVLHDRPAHGHVAMDCASASWHVGERVHVLASSNAGAQSLRADRVTLYSVDLRHALNADGSSYEQQNPDLDIGQSSALLEERPQFRRASTGWQGSVWLDGYPIRIDTKSTLLASSSETRLLYGEQSGGLKLGPSAEPHPTPLPADTVVAPNMWTAYLAGGIQPGEPYAGRIQFWPNQISPSERTFLDRFVATITLPDFAHHADGRIRFVSGKEEISLSIVADDAVQRYVQKVGKALIPQYQLELADADPTKVHFQFLVVREIDADAQRYLYKRIDAAAPGNRIWSFPHKMHIWNEPALALPNGVILVSAKALGRLRSEAELATILSYSVSMVVQKLSFLHASASRLAVQGNNITASQYERAMRLAIRQLYLSGYDPREAPTTWAQTQKKADSNPVIDSPHPDRAMSWEEAYTFDYLSMYYRDVDYSKLKQGKEEYQQFLDELHRAGSNASG